MMKLYNQKVFFVILLGMVSFGIAPLVVAEVTPNIFLGDSNSPVEYQEIMVGTELTFVIYSDTAIDWNGGLALIGESINKAILSNAQPLPAAGAYADAPILENVGIQGFYLRGGVWYWQAGDWFTVDYTATEIGDCDVAFFDYDPFEPYIPTYNIEFTHVPTRDFDGNTKVDFGDFALLSLQWNRSDCEDPNWCQGTDLDASGTVDIYDLMLFTEFWLEKTK